MGSQVRRRKRFVSKLYKAYLALTIAAQKEGGSRTTCIKRFGAFEVRLVELVASQKADALDLWIELYSHESQSSLDSCSCNDLDEAEPLLEHLICSARELNETSAT
jgi:hypothetical protein